MSIKLPIMDLHCDLPLYLANGENRTAYDADARCSLAQLAEGGVKWQVMALFQPTQIGSTLQAEIQFQSIRTLASDDIAYSKTPLLDTLSYAFAIESASCLVEEDEPLELAFRRFTRFDPVYISLTWNEENRFGGGASSPQIGLKADGKHLLEFLSGKGCAIDLSHTSDRLAENILDCIDAQQLDLRVIASHSNCRAVTDVPRNLPDYLIKEIFNRNGIVGLNFVRKFVGSNSADLFTHLDHLIKLGGEDKICFGGDFFCLTDLPPAHLTADTGFYPEYANASCYPNLLSHISEPLRSKLAWKNAYSFFSKDHLLRVEDKYASSNNLRR